MNPTDTTDTTVVTPAGAPKALSKKTRAVAIFAAAMATRAAGGFDSNKAFRAAVLTKIQTDLGVSVASAATMYNAAKKDAEAADANVGLGRDPKKEKPVSTGKRGRPAGSKNKDKEGGVSPTVTEGGTIVIDPPVEALDAEAAAA
jgi:hypothetical protein